jgi:hypothetical protein
MCAIVPSVTHKWAPYVPADPYPVVTLSATAGQWSFVPTSLMISGVNRS